MNLILTLFPLFLIYTLYTVSGFVVISATIILDVFPLIVVTIIFGSYGNLNQSYYPLWITHGL